MDYYISSGLKKLRCGYTTGSTATMAAKAATQMLFSKDVINSVGIMTPKGLYIQADVVDVNICDNLVKCAVCKDGGDDIDVTNGILIYAEVKKIKEDGIFIDGGKGVGRITKNGLQQPVGFAAINDVPRSMIEREIKNICDKYSYYEGIYVEISVPNGEEIAKKTFNPRLGIEGGISIIGTSGIVEPQSLKALLESIYIEMKMYFKNGIKNIIITPGNYGEEFLKNYPHLKNVTHLKCSNFIGDTIDFALEFEFKKILLIGHIGKFVKLAGGIMNTHSKYADSRTEIFAAHAALNGANIETISQIMQSITADECIEILKNNNIFEQTIGTLLKKMQFYLDNRVQNTIEIGAIVFSNKYGLLGITQKGKELIDSIADN